MRHLGPGATTGGSGALVRRGSAAGGVGAHPVCSLSTVTAPSPSTCTRIPGTSDAATARAAAPTTASAGAGDVTKRGMMRRCLFSPAAVLAHPSTRAAPSVCGGSSGVTMAAPCGDAASTAAAPHTSARQSTTARQRARDDARSTPAAPPSHATTTSAPRRSAGTSASSTAAGPSQATVPGGRAAHASTGGSGTPTERQRRGGGSSGLTRRDCSRSRNRTGSPPSVTTTMSNTMSSSSDGLNSLSTACTLSLPCAATAVAGHT